METYCKNCGTKLDYDAQFCPDCGAKIEKPIPQPTNDVNFCPNCGESIEHSDGFCENCGNSLIPQKESFFEKNKIPIIIISTVIVVMVIILATLSLTMPVDVGTQTVSVGSHDFEIRGDYVVDPSTIDVDYTGYSAVFSQGYSNDEDAISIGVMTVPYNVDGEEVAASEGGTHENLMGVSGYYTVDDGIHTFAFADGMYLMVISATSRDALEEITYLGW